MQWKAYSNANFFTDWFTTPNTCNKVNTLIINRITERIKASSQIPKYYGKTITKEQAITILNNNKQ